MLTKTQPRPQRFCHHSATAPRARAFPPLALALLPLLAACPGTSKVRTEGNRAVRPGWIPRPNRSHPSLLYVTGTCRDQGALATARACAIDDARRQIQQQLGQPVEIKGSYVEDEHSELRATPSGRVRDFWVLIAFPREELRKEEARIANRVLLGLRCEAEPADCCDPRYPERIEAAMTSVGMAPAPERLAPPLLQAPLKKVLDRAARLQAARVLLGRVSGRFLSSMDGEFYAEARCDYRLIDAVSGKVQRTFESGPVKGGHINKQAAVRKALDNCIAKFTANLGR